MRLKLLLLSLLCSIAVMAQQQSIAILGDSYSTFEGYITPADNITWYFQNENPKQTDVYDVRQTWWHILCQENNYRIAINNSYSGATICYTGYNGEDYKSRSFITRADNLGEPDIILVFGATNDSWAGSPLGEMQYDHWTNDDLYSYRPAICYLANYLVNRYLFTDIYFILNSELKPEIGQAMHEAAEHYGITVIDLHDIDKLSGHPSIAGMRAIADQVAQAIKR